METKKNHPENESHFTSHGTLKFQRFFLPRIFVASFAVEIYNHENARSKLDDTQIIIQSWTPKWWIDWALCNTKMNRDGKSRLGALKSNSNSYFDNTISFCVTTFMSLKERENRAKRDYIIAGGKKNMSKAQKRI